LIVSGTLANTQDIVEKGHKVVVVTLWLVAVVDCEVRVVYWKVLFDNLTVIWSETVSLRTRPV